MANLPAVEMTSEQEQRLRTIATEAYENYMTKSTQEVREAAQVKKPQEAPENAAERLATFQEMFEAADANCDGRVDRSEFRVLMATVLEQ